MSEVTEKAQSVDSGVVIMNAHAQIIPKATSSGLGSLITGFEIHPPEKYDESFGRKKAPPESDPSLKKEATTTEELAKYTFTLGVPIQLAFVKEETTQVTAPVVIPISSGSSTSSAENTSEVFVSTPSDKQRKINKSLLLRTESRQGRETQRWLTEADTHQRVRLVTGCVPILTGGRIVFVSSSRKPEWILPKGGWEEDETMEESAIREAYEEAGVLGTLGPALDPIQYETRKSKKRRMEKTEMLRKCGTFDDGTFDEGKDTHQIIPFSSMESVHQAPSEAAIKVTPPSYSILPDAVMNKIRESKSTVRSDETSSNASDSSSSFFVKLTMFPLYVSEIRDTWPECGRFRKVVHIDEAIEMLESRVELRSAVMQIKERNLHLMEQTQPTVVQKRKE